MLAALGTHRFDVTHDAVLLATAAPEADPSAATASWTAAPDAVLLLADELAPAAVAGCVAAWREAVDIPLVVRTPGAAAAARALAAGAAAVHDPTGFTDPAVLDAVVAAGGSVVVGCPAVAPVDPGARTARLVALAERARSAGVPPGSVVVDVTPGPAVAPDDVRRLEELPAVAAAGWPVLVVVADPSGPDGGLAVAAAHALVLPRGARLLPTDDVRTTRRVARVAAELLRARDAAGAAR